ncbi:Terpenoid cyclases/protein prenyltransferase alpha-alpha toroid [Arabidopsis suecica]|uniref:Terpenoid cyclases/protein prenyltransferase alpha-alpha toroid n=1 Tax=Arabidopsis suecica TaxID=45249 RepID=A0A8T2BEJ4_ARASU|nr:Terpenoid cyclases/protein prenyltransferase alpha-alpha toroid [Arabidopsis suecica]
MVRFWLYMLVVLVIFDSTHFAIKRHLHFLRPIVWKLNIAEGGSPWLRTTNNHVERQFWEFDPKLGTPEDLSAVEKARKSFSDNRFLQKHSSDLLMRLQVLSLPSLSIR